MKSAVAFFRTRFAAAGTAERARYERAYMKSELAFHGVDAAAVRDAGAEFVKAHKEALDHDGVVGVVEALYATDWFDLRSAAIGVLERKRKLLAPKDAAWLVKLVRKSGCWAHVDWLATKIVPHALPEKPARLLRQWARDDDFWVRRTALLAQLDALRAGGGDFPLFAELAVPMLGEREFFIRKAIGWVLRDTSKRRPELVAGFVRAHGAAMSGLTYREATRRLPERLRVELARPAVSASRSRSAPGRRSAPRSSAAA
ncbi:MAG TPA: DNA alkylation repair protein, partial [Polyangia bacterium]